MKTVRLQDIRPLVRYAGPADIRRYDPVRTRIAYDHRLFYAPEGGVCLTAGLYTRLLPPGALVLIQSGIPYRIRAERESVTIMSLNFDFFGGPGEDHEPEALPIASPENFNPENLRESLRFENGFLDGGAEWGEAAGGTEDLLSSILREYSLAERGYCASVSGLTQSLMIALARGFRTVRENRGIDRRALLAYIGEHCTENLTNTVLAEKFHYHPNYISALVREQTGLPLHRYILRLRIRRATQLLLYTDLTVAAIAMEVGFRDAAYFTHYYRTVTGQLPGELRARGGDL